MSTELKWLQSARLRTFAKSSFASSWNLISLLPSGEEGNQGVFSAAGRQPLVVHGNPASGKMLGGECVGAQMMLSAVPAWMCQYDLWIYSSEEKTKNKTKNTHPY